MSESIGHQIIDRIVTGKLLHAMCTTDDSHGCMVVWSSGAVEQLDALVAEYNRQQAEKPGKWYSEQAVANLTSRICAERDALRIEYESRALWIAKMLQILGCENKDGLHYRDPHNVAQELIAERDQLRAASLKTKPASETS